MPCFQLLLHLQAAVYFEQEQAPNLHVSVQTTQCNNELPEPVFYGTALSVAVGGYVLPIFVAVFFSARLLLAASGILPSSSSASTVSICHPGVRQTAHTAASLVLLHLTSCSAHWLLVACGNVSRSVRDDRLYAQAMQWVSMMPFFSYAFNWLLLRRLSTTTGGKRADRRHSDTVLTML